MSNFKKSCLISSIACITLSGAAYAGDKDDLMQATALLNGEVNNGMQVIGSINDVVLDEYSDSVDYVLFEVTEVFRPVQSEETLFATTSNLEFAPARTAGDWQIVLEDTDGDMAPQEIAVTEDNADRRLLSGLLDNSVYFTPGESREIEDVLINPETGEIAYYRIALESDDLLGAEVHAIPASEVHVDLDGLVTTSLTLMDLGNEQMETGSESQY